MNTFNDSVLHIDEAHSLKQSLKRKATKVRFALTGKDEPSKRNNVLNTVLDEMQWRQPSDVFCPVNDCLVGVVNLDWGGSKTLSVSMLYLILQTIENINTANVKAMTGMSDSNSRRYVQASRIVMPYLEKIFQEDEESLDTIAGIDDTKIHDLGDY